MIISDVDIGYLKIVFGFWTSRNYSTMYIIIWTFLNKNKKILVQYDWEINFGIIWKEKTISFNWLSSLFVLESGWTHSNKQQFSFQEDISIKRLFHCVLFGEKGCSLLKIRDIKHPIVFITIFLKWRRIEYSRLYYCIFYDDNSFHVISFVVCTTSNKVHFQLLMNLDFQSIIFISTDQLATEKKFKPGKKVFSDKSRD